MYLADSRSAQTAAPDTRPGRRPAAAPGTVLALGAVSLITDISSEMVTAVLPLYVVTALGLSPLGFGVLDGISNGVGAPVRLLGGRLADRDGDRRHKSVAGIGYGLSALCKPVLLFGVICLRFHAAAGTGICLRGRHGALQDTCRAVVPDSRLHELHRFPAAGIPTRARVAPSGHLVARTVFVDGNSYAGTDSTTRTAIVDTRTWALDDDLERYTVTKDGRPYRASDINIWGVTFAGRHPLPRHPGDPRPDLPSSGVTSPPAPSPPCTGTSNALRSRRTAPASPTRSASREPRPTPRGGCMCSICAARHRPRPPSSATSTTRRCGRTTPLSSTPSPATTARTCGPSRPTAPVRPAG
ncbi:hypothetical protein ACFRQM_14935 [Streptomyces sp. NPDC056831]|uniref:hypothetical protein n=1 Tax=Streptomyces sp. NPDC056831 TaxID=3345954 RepID=UPI0036D193F2